MRQNYNNRQQQKPQTPEQAFEDKLKKFLKISKENQKFIKKSKNRKVIDTTYKLSIARFSKRDKED